MRLTAFLLALVTLASCTRTSRAPDAGAGAVPDAAGGSARAGHPEREVLPQCPEGAGDYLERAAGFYDSGEFPKALACAVQAAALEPELADAHAEHAAALVGTGRLEEARIVYARALALDPDHRDALLGASDLYAVKLPFARPLVELGLAYAERGRRLASGAGDRELAGRFAALAATALNDLGRAGPAIERADEALAAGVEADLARFEKASALWELCRFEEAEAVFASLADSPSFGARAHYYLGLIAERGGGEEAAAAHLAEARSRDPEAFPEHGVSPAEFEQMVAAAVRALPADVRRDLAGPPAIPITTQDLPDLEDLTAVEPPLSPTIVGLFRGPSLGEPCPEPPEGPGPCRAIVLYRRNMARSVKDLDELRRQVEVTLNHEVGHLRGEDDVQLVARGLE